MTTDTLVALSLFALVASITPGPNNMMLLASGANHGFLRTLPHMLGVATGFIVMIVLVGLGIGQILTADPRLHAALRIGSLIYLLWLAWRIAQSGPIGEKGEEIRGEPLTFLQAALFQWVNPKAWAMALTATATFIAPADYLTSLSAIALVFAIVNVPSISLWAGFGVALRPLLMHPLRARIFNVTMAVLLVLSVVPSLL